MLNLNKILTLKLVNSSSVITSINDTDNLLKLNSTLSDGILEVDTVFELTNIFSELQQSLFGTDINSPYINLNSALGLKGILLKDHPLYQEQSILDLVNAKSPNSDFEIEVELSVKKLDDDSELIEDFESVEELETYIEETFFNSAIDGILGMSGNQYLTILIKNHLLSKFIDFVNNEDINTKKYIIQILSEALAPISQMYNIKFENRKGAQSEKTFFMDTVDGLAGHSSKEYLTDLIKYDLLSKFIDFVVKNKKFTEEEKIEILSNAMLSIEIK